MGSGGGDRTSSLVGEERNGKSKRTHSLGVQRISRDEHSSGQKEKLL